MRGMLSLLLAAALAPETTVTTDTIQLVESFPVETTLDHSDLPQTAGVWMDMIDGAQEEICFSHFYASTHPDSVLEQVIAAIERAGERGVQVRFLVSETFRDLYAEVPERLGALEGVEHRWINFKALTGGVMHAKYMVVDGRDLFLGSPNFDSRAMNHIQELGVRLQSPRVGRAVMDVFERDWATAGGEPLPWPRSPKAGFPVRATLDASQGGGEVQVTPLFSPTGQLPNEASYTWPALLETIETARKSLRAQVLTYDMVGYDREYFVELEAALRSAAARGVKVELLVADWCKRKGVVEGLQSLQCLENVEVRFAVIPDWSGGFIPFSRVVHAKLLVADERRVWIGSSNWERTYFTTSRNAGLLLEGETIGARLARWFDHTWDSEYAEVVDPGAKYEPRRRR